MEHAERERGMDIPEQGTGYTVAEVAAALGVSQRAIRARIRRGTLAAYAIAGPRGMEYRVTRTEDIQVSMEGGMAEGSRKGNREHITVPVPPAAWERERADLVAQVEWLRGQVETQTERAAEAMRLLESEQNQRAAIEARIIRALPAPAAEPEGVTIEQDPQPAEGVTPEPRRRWWRFGR